MRRPSRRSERCPGSSCAGCGCGRQPGGSSQTWSSGCRLERPWDRAMRRATPARGRGRGRVRAGGAGGRGQAAPAAGEAAVQGALPDSDVVVHVEPQQDHAALRERTLAAAQRVPRVREIHNLSVLLVGGETEVSLHLKLPGDLPLEEAHEVATEVERAIVESVPEVDSVQTHLEPLAETGEGRSVVDDDADRGRVE